MRVHIPQPLRSYTGRRGEVEAKGETVDALLHDLDARFPGLRFRMVDEQDALRPHVKVFVNKTQVDGLDALLRPDDEVHIFQALSGG